MVDSEQPPQPRYEPFVTAKGRQFWVPTAPGLPIVWEIAKRSDVCALSRDFDTSESIIVRGNPQNAIAKLLRGSPDR